MPLVPAFGALGRRAASRAALVLGLAAGWGGAAAPAHADRLGPLTPVSAGRSPFASCTADTPAQQAGTAYPNSEVEPWVDADPRNARNLVAGWQQDRWSNAGARGLAVGYSRDGGRTWKTTIPPKLSRCSGGKFQRATDPWVSFAADGAVHLMSLSTDEDRPDGGIGRHAMLATRSTDGGRSWGDPITLIEDDDPQVQNDKNALTADPANPSFAYAVWHRLRDFRLPEEAKGGGALGAWRRAKFLRSLAAEAAPVYFEGPTWFARTTNGGRSWEAAKPIFDPGGNAQTFANQVHAGRGGRCPRRCFAVRCRGRPEERRSPRRLAGHALSRRRPGRLRPVDRRRPHLVQARAGRQDPRQRQPAARAGVHPLGRGRRRRRGDRDLLRFPPRRPLGRAH
jgi:hypothetical protein